MGLKERIESVKSQAVIKTNDAGELVCPLTGKVPIGNRCVGQHWRRMLKTNEACEVFCTALLDDLKNSEFGGRASINFNLESKED
jgi:hypothetical protein